MFLQDRVNGLEQKHLQMESYPWSWRWFDSCSKGLLLWQNSSSNIMKYWLLWPLIKPGYCYMVAMKWHSNSLLTRILSASTQEISKWSVTMPAVPDNSKHVGPHQAHFKEGMLPGFQPNWLTHCFWGMPVASEHTVNKAQKRAQGML